MNNRIEAKELISNLLNQIDSIKNLKNSNSKSLSYINSDIRSFYYSIDSKYLTTEDNELNKINSLFSELHVIGRKKAKKFKLVYTPSKIILKEDKGKKVKINILTVASFRILTKEEAKKEGLGEKPDMKKAFAELQRIDRMLKDRTSMFDRDATEEEKLTIVSKTARSRSYLTVTATQDGLQSQCQTSTIIKGSTNKERIAKDVTKKLSSIKNESVSYDFRIVTKEDDNLIVEGSSGKIVEPIDKLSEETKQTYAEAIKFGNTIVSVNTGYNSRSLEEEAKEVLLHMVSIIEKVVEDEGQKQELLPGNPIRDETERKRKEEEKRREHERGQSFERGR